MIGNRVEGLKVTRAAHGAPSRLLFVVGTSLFAVWGGLGIESSAAQQTMARNDPQHQRAARKPDVATSSDSTSAADAKLARRSQTNAVAKGPYYVDFRARTAASYGHAFVWYGKTNERQVEVAGLHPKGDELPYILGHLMWVPAETGASYGDLDEQYLTASYRVYLNEADAKKVFAYIKHLQATSPVWNAETTNCTSFIGRIASFMGLETPFHLKLPEDYVNQLKALNGGRRMVQLASDR
jgi:hypothetical protein